MYPPCILTEHMRSLKLKEDKAEFYCPNVGSSLVVLFYPYCFSAIIIPWRITLFRRWGIHCSLLCRGFFKGLTSRGVAVVVFGMMESVDEFNNIHVYRRCKEAGATAICTDKPSLLLEMLSLEGSLDPLPCLA